MLHIADLPTPSRFSPRSQKSSRQRWHNAPSITFNYAFNFQPNPILNKFLSLSQCALWIATFISNVVEHWESLLLCIMSKNYVFFLIYLHTFLPQSQCIISTCQPFRIKLLNIECHYSILHVMSKRLTFDSIGHIWSLRMAKKFLPHNLKKANNLPSSH